MVTLKRALIGLVIPTTFLIMPAFALANTIVNISPTVSSGKYVDFSTLPEAIHGIDDENYDGGSGGGNPTVTLRGASHVADNVHDLRTNSSGGPFLSNGVYNIDYYNSSKAIGTTGYITFFNDASVGINSLDGVTNFYWFKWEKTASATYTVVAGGIDLTTHIVSFTPLEGAITSNDVTFALHIYINPDDLGTFLGVQIGYQNIDQNYLLSNIPGVTHDQVLFAGQATTSGDFYYTATTTLPDGNYRAQASIKRTLIGTFINPFSHINDTQNHQFVVNQGTYIGNLNQNGFNEFNSILGSTTATSTAASSINCNPLTFAINQCLAFLFIPGGPQLDNSIQSFQDGVATRWPWGYFYRVYSIFANPATNTLPSFTTDIVIGPPGNLATTSLTYDPGDMIAGAGSLLETVHDNQHGKSFREVMEPFVLLVVALMVVFTIFSDITGSHKHHQEQASHKLS